jgi:hypothetical protein
MRFSLLSTILLIILAPVFLNAQQKLLTVDDIFDPVKKINFGGNNPTIRWLKDGKHYLVTNEATRSDVPRIQKVDAVSGEAVAFFDAAKMQAAFAALPGIRAEDAKQTAIVVVTILTPVRVQS